ncbi:MAG: Bax inhibitor-1/YccA family protein [Candidatus Omnitrophota bacterium]
MDQQRISTTTSAQASESNFISRVYLWMAAGLGISTLAAFCLLCQPVLMRMVISNKLIFIGLIIAEFALVMWLSVAAMRMSALKASILFVVYSVLNGVTLSAILLVYTGGSVMTTFAVCAGTFLFFSMYGATTKKDLTSMGGFMMMGLIGVVLASFVNMFLKSSALGWVMTFVGIAVFMGLTAYDTQQLKAIHAMGFQDREMEKKTAILGALKLYLDFINLFLMLLRVFGKGRD